MAIQSKMLPATGTCLLWPQVWCRHFHTCCNAMPVPTMPLSIRVHVYTSRERGPGGFYILFSTKSRLCMLCFVLSKTERGSQPTERLCSPEDTVLSRHPTGRCRTVCDR
jgi:hypothetical protein